MMISQVLNKEKYFGFKKKLIKCKFWVLVKNKI